MKQEVKALGIGVWNAVCELFLRPVEVQSTRRVAVVGDAEQEEMTGLLRHWTSGYSFVALLSRDPGLKPVPVLAVVAFREINWTMGQRLWVDLETSWHVLRVNSHRR